MIKNEIYQKTRFFGQSTGIHPVKGLTFHKFVLWLVLALGGCHQIQSRLLADSENLFNMLTHQVGLAETKDAISPMNSSVQNAPYQNPSITDQETTTSQEGIKIPSSVSAQTNKLLQPMELDKDCNYCPDLVGVPAGLALLGSLPDEKDRESDEGPIQKVLMKAFAIGKYEVTKAQWRFFIEQSGYTTTQGCLTWVGDGYDKPPKVNWKETGFTQTDHHPVVCVSWLDVNAYTQWLSKISQKSYRLPTEMEWEYVTKADQGLVPFPWPSGESPCNRANLADQSLLRLYPNWRLAGCNDGFEFTSPVGSFAANPWGIYDLQGNVAEWMSDCYSSTIQAKPSKNSECMKRVIKGGGWDMTEKYIRNAYRGRASQHIRSTGIGFRVVRDLD